jgi:hemolysin D
MAALSLSGLLFATIAWACLGQVDMVSSAKGKLVPVGGGKVVQPLDVGMVTAIRVHDGQYVHKGDILVELEPTESRSERDRLEGELSSAKLDVARLQTVALGKPFVGPYGSEYGEAAVARREAASARAELEGKLATLDRQIQQRRAELDEGQAEVARLEALLPIDHKSTAVFQALAEKGYGSTLQLLQAQEKEADTAHQLEVQRRKAPELEAEIAALHQQRAETAAETAKADLGDLSDAETKAAGLQQQLTGAEEKLRTRTLVAPVDGTVQELAVHTVGGVVQPAETLMRIAPAGVGVEVEAKLANKDVGFVHIGMPVAVKVETFPFTRYGVIKGRVTDVSDDAVSEKQPDGSEELTYLVHVALSRDTLDVDGRTVRLGPGMAVTAEVKTGKRRVIQYVLSPLAKAMNEAGRER